MFETKTYEALLASALARVPSGIDKREGSMVMNGVAPSMAELAQLYIGLDFVFTATYLATAPREYLIKRAADRNMSPYPASAAVFRELCRQAQVPCQTFFNRSDIVGGSTLGNLSNGQVALHTVDIGLPQLAMHSPYETAGVEDTAWLVKAARAFYGADIAIRGDGCYRVTLGE